MAATLLTTVEAAKLYGTSASSISRAASAAAVGARRSDGRLLGLSQSDLRKLVKFLRFSRGNPNWKRKYGHHDANSKA